MSNEKLIPELRFPEFKNDREWEENTIGEVFNSFSGGTPSTSEREYYGGKIPFIRSAEINREKTELFLTEEGLKNSSAKIVNKGDLLVALYGANSGDSAISKINGAINQAILCLQSKYSNAFTYYFLTLKKEWIISKFIQGGQGNLSGDIVKSITVPFPNKEEQQKIASCLSSLDEVIAAHSQKLDLLKDHKIGLMQNLFPQEGVMVPKFRFKEFENDGDWEEKKLGEVIKYFKGYAFQSINYTSKGRRIIRVSDMGFDFIKNEENAIYINEGTAIQYEKWQLKKDDLIITTVGSKPPMYDSLVGRKIIVESKDEDALLNQNAVCLRANSKITQGFLNTIFKKIEYVNFIESIIRGNANQGSIALEDLFKYKFLQPNNPKEQQKIASCLSSLDALITAQAEKIEHLKLHKKGLMQGLFPKIQD
ncbi:MAG: restriction endonuclease subunit S [Saprospiraceae bacterium]|nr:restriction endonuclease subunit S [Saprospiraceae bacterium]